jgi:hypothetical protein
MCSFFTTLKVLHPDMFEGRNIGILVNVWKDPDEVAAVTPQLPGLLNSELATFPLPGPVPFGCRVILY